ncbi:hypothetical protein V9L05_11775 [Bernardetia sp. Wsw4-3y2]|uniref:hypothetical protein n=1 Tax=Bernardetia sp. Wsw4-3y2 TaxID=3127471 RepID=UPI0030D36B2A
MTKFLFFFVCMGVILPFIFLKDVYPFHRFGMFAEPVKHQSQYEKFYIFYKLKSQNKFTELNPQSIPLNANAFEMQLRKHHYQKKHAIFITIFEDIIKNKINLKEDEKLEWKWYHVIQKQDSKNEIDSLCVFSN